MINFSPSTTYDVRMRAMYCSDPDPATGWSAWTSSTQVTMADPCPDLANMAVQIQLHVTMMLMQLLMMVHVSGLHVPLLVMLHLQV